MKFIDEKKSFTRSDTGSVLNMIIFDFKIMALHDKLVIIQNTRNITAIKLRSVYVEKGRQIESLEPFLCTIFQPLI